MLMLLLCCLFCRCNPSHRDWRHEGTWLFNNTSSHHIEISGVVVHFSIVKHETATIKPHSGYVVYYNDFGSKTAQPDEIPFPLGNFREVSDCSIRIDGGKKIALKPGSGIRNRRNYKVEVLCERSYRFTFDITDEFVSELLKSSE